MRTYQWDGEKAQNNLQHHGIDFSDVLLFDWENAKTIEDVRIDYGETRYVSLGLIDKRVHILVWTPRGHDCRVISLRKANGRERKAYYE